ncbi:translation factor Sua5, putative [Babesia ovis]|uniref:Translation factor Sua5, putative n=1 Tax=Babesia ovis TaxID=5869 RepID=A0A9W5WVA5_BABOV|nr:translation factor Sua5, putative [Babesia ovis]
MGSWSSIDWRSSGRLDVRGGTATREAIVTGFSSTMYDMGGRSPSSISDRVVGASLKDSLSLSEKGSTAWTTGTVALTLESDFGIGTLIWFGLTTIFAKLPIFARNLAFLLFNPLAAFFINSSPNGIGGGSGSTGLAGGGGVALFFGVTGACLGAMSSAIIAPGTVGVVVPDLGVVLSTDVLALVPVTVSTDFLESVTLVASPSELTNREGRLGCSTLAPLATKGALTFGKIPPPGAPKG